MMPNSGLVREERATIAYIFPGLCLQIVTCYYRKRRHNKQRLKFRPLILLATRLFQSKLCGLKAQS